MTDSVPLGEITCPSGELVLMDGGYLGLWSGAGAPDSKSAVDFEIVGPDAEAAARSFDRQPGRMLYDIPEHAVAEFISGTETSPPSWNSMRQVPPGPFR